MTDTITALSPMDAQRLTQRIKLVAATVRDNLVKLRGLVEQARVSQAWQVLGYPSWTAYLADTLADEPMRLGREERQELVGYLAGEGLSSRAIAPIVGSSYDTVQRDIRADRNLSPSPAPALVSAAHHEFPNEDTWHPDTGFVDEITGEVTEADAEPSLPAPAPLARTITGLDGKTYTQPSEPRTPRRSPLTDTARNVGFDARKLAERLQRLAADDRFTRNKEEVASLIRGHLMFTVEVCQDLLDTFNQSERTD